MSFIWPQALFLFIIVPIYIFLHFYFEKKKTKDIIPFGNLELLQESISKTNKIDILKHFPLLLKILIISMLLFSISRPTSMVKLPMKNTKVMLLMDVSISMEADDIRPDRITAAKEAAKRFINDLPQGIKVGFGTFSGNIKILTTPTLDKLQALKFLNILNAEKLEPGTDIGNAILSGTEALTLDDKETSKKKNERIIVLITDGESNVGADPIFAAAQAKVNNITIHSIGIGNSFGTIIRGNILTRLDEFTLKEISSLTSGYYFNAQNFEDMNIIYKKINQSIKLVPRKIEVTFIPISIALVLLIIFQLLRWSRFRFA